MKKLPNFKAGRPHNARKHKRVLTKKHLGAGWQKQQIAARKKAEADHRLAQMNVHNLQHGFAEHHETIEFNPVAEEGAHDAANTP
jgi:hypothetical protein